MSDALLRRILSRIRREGPITFADYMTIALYDPASGFYADPPVGAGKDFVTSPHVSSAFGTLLARQIEGMWNGLGRPARYDLVEVGAGDGTLATQILDAAGGDFKASLRYAGVEIGPGAREALAERGLRAAAALTDIEPFETGCVLAHELIDNLPFHRLRARGGRIVEVFVGAEDGRLVDVEAPATRDALDAIRAPLADGEDRPVSPAALRFVHAAALMLRRGHLLVYDYELAADGRPRAYRAHRVGEGVLDAPGSADITAGADFDALAAEARAAGLAVWGPATQRDVLLALGFREWLDDLRSRRLQAESDRDTAAILRLVSEQSRAPLLVDPAHLGAHLVLAVGVGGAAPPPGFPAGNPPAGLA